MTISNAIGILGGSFDPIHIGHLRMAHELAQQLSLPKVHLIPSHQPVHRGAPLATPQQRLEMLALATADNPLFMVDPREINREGPSYTIDTLIELKRELPNTTLCLFLGMDAFLGLHTWHRHEELLHYAHVIVAQRPSYPPPANNTDSGIGPWLKNQKQADLAFIKAQNAGGILFLPTTCLDISSSAIRKEIAMGGNPRYLLPNDVYLYTQLNGTYRR